MTGRGAGWPSRDRHRGGTGDWPRDRDRTGRAGCRRRCSRPLRGDGDRSRDQGRGHSALAVRADVTDTDDRTGMVDQALTTFGRIDILVNNAGIYRSVSPLEITEEHWDALLAVNSKAVLFCTQAVLPTMLTARRGRLCNLASRARKVRAPTGRL